MITSLFTPRALYITLAVSMVNAASAQTIDGILESAKDVIIRTTIDGTVTKTHFNEGEQVSHGDMLASFADAEQLAKVELAKTIATASSAIDAAKNRSLLASRKHRDLELALQNNAATDWEVLDAKANKTLATIELTAAREERAANQQRLKLEEEVLSRYHFTAPFEGTISEFFITEGQSVSRGEKIARLVNTSALEIETFIDAKHFTLLEKEKTYSANVSAPFNNAFQAKLSFIDPVFDSATGSVRVVFTVDNDGTLPVGTNVIISLRDKITLASTTANGE